ncbi:TPA: aromatic alcohol reductase, partial [Stenotrophomonas maltophilia]
YLAGDTVRYEQLPAILEEKFGAPFKLIVWSVPQLMEELVSDPSSMIRKYRAAFAQGRGVSWSLDGTFNASIGVKLEGVDDWLKAHFET